MKHGKKYIEAAKQIERGNLYEKTEAIALVKKAAVAKFDETIEAHIRTGCDGRHADQQIRGAVVLPHLSLIHISAGMSCGFSLYSKASGYSGRTIQDLIFY